MAILKCKMCGGDLEIKENSTVCKCEYCGTTQTLPKIDNDRKANLYDRANHFRRNNEFDKAMGIYEQILNDDGSDAEAYWSLVLCRYGIEYVEDPTTHKRVPTVNRAQFTSIFDDANYQSALEHADSAQREVYKAEAEAINEIQKGILEISSKEEPFDVFICYKETDNNGRRTPDSVLANDLYHQLTQEGFKVFFARITLEDKLGSAYEPYIFAALNSAKVMVVLGTKPEYFNAVWVKNEWSRYLALIKSGAKKMLIPAYKDMDPYDLPEEFSHLQAQDMAKLGFMQDLIRGIKKITAVDEPKAVKQETVVVQSEGNSNITALLKRAKMALEDGEFAKADDFCEQVLNQDAENAEAYLYKLYAEFKICNRDKLRTRDKNADIIKNSKNFAKACKFGKQAELDEDINEILYNQAAREEEKAHSEEDYKSAAKCFREIAGYKDSVARVKNCIEKGKECAYQIAEKAFASANNEEAYNRTADLYRHVSGYKDADEKAEKAIEAGKECAYQLAEKAFENANNEEAYNKAAELYRHVSGYKDADNQMNECIKKGQEAAELEAQKLAEKISVLAEVRKNLSIAKKLLIQTPELQYPMHLGLAINGRVYISCMDAYRSKAESWTDIVELSSGNFHVVGLKSDGTACSTGDNKYGQCNVSGWSNIVQISAGYWHSVGLKEDGTVVAVGRSDYGRTNVSSWSDIVKIDAGRCHTVGLKSNGTVVATGYNPDGRCDVSGWRDIVNIWAFNAVTVGLKKDGTVVAAGSSQTIFDVSNWTDIVDISIGYECIMGLKSNGTVLSTGQTEECNIDVSGWRDIVAISAKNIHAVGLCADGTVVATGDNDNGQCNVKEWRHIVAISAGEFCTLGLKNDGSVEITGVEDAQPYINIPYWKLFNNYDNILSEQKDVQKSRDFRRQGLCQYCGGTFKGLLSKKCALCGKKKDY